MTAKETVRRKVLKLRDCVDTEYRNSAALKVTEKFMSLWPDYKSYALYCALNSELSIYPLMHMLWSAGKSVLLPKMEDNRIKLHYCYSTDELQCGYMNIMEPIGDSTTEEVDLIAIPGIAFDRNGYRLGYGKGCYDRLLEGMPRKIAVGLAFDVQIVDFVPRETHDVAMDAVLTEKELIAGNGILYTTKLQG